MPEIHYNPNVKILSIKFNKSKSVDSDIKDNVILDYDKNGHLVNIDIMEVNIEDILKSSKSLKKKGTLSSILKHADINVDDLKK